MSLAGKWGYSTNEESYFGSFDTKEEAIAEAEACEDVDTDYWVGQFKDPIIQVCASQVIDQISEQVGDECGEFAEDWPGRIPTDAENELANELTEVLLKWMKKYKLMPTFATVDSDTIEQRSVPDGNGTSKDN